MFIRESKTTNKKTGKVYIKHTLVKSIRTERGPRQRVVMGLGKLSIDRSLWPDLAYGLESYINGDYELEKISLFELSTEVLEQLVVFRAKISYDREQTSIVTGAKDAVSEKRIESVDVNTLTVTESRTVGPELVANNGWENLNFEDILSDCDFDKKDIALAAGVIWGRLISPGSDMKTWRWIRESSSLPDFFDADISRVHKDKVYAIADKLLKNKDTLESRLYENQKRCFGFENRLFLFDLTNFYFEGKCEGNELAKRGKSKEKRSQNVLVSLALVVDQHGFPVRSEVYSGNIGEPSTLKEILEKCGLLDDDSQEILPFRPVLAMDRGIATKENIDFIKKHNFPYTVIQRADKSKKFEDEFKKLEGFIEIKDSKDQTIHLKRIGNELLCLSDYRAKKELAITNKKVKRVLDELSKMDKALKKGTLKKESSIQQRIGRIKGNNPGFDNLVEFEFDKNNSSITYKEKPRASALSGCYVIETEGVEGDEELVWRTYTTLTKVEAAFRCMKTDLGTRPVYHHGEERTRAHLFISILAYHLLMNIEYRLRQNGSPAQWKYICELMKSHTRNVIEWRDEKEDINHKKSNAKPEPKHANIYKILGVRNPLKEFIY